MEALVKTSYSTELVVLSYAISVIGAFIALYSAGRLRPNMKNKRAYFFNVTSAGVALGGIGVWSMHFIAMLAMRMDVGLGYSMWETLISLVAAIAISAFAFHIVALNPRSVTRLFSAGAMLGMGAVVMHYLGMFGMRFPGYIIWSWGIIAISVVIAMVAASAALWLAFRTKSLAMRGVAAAVMGVAVCSMHYTGMAAADFVCTSASQRFATPQGLLVFSSMELPLLTAIAAIGMAVLIGYDQLLQRNFGARRVRRA